MGIYDREYYRRDGPGFLGALSGRGQVCKILIAVNVLFFLVQAFGPAGQAGDRPENPFAEEKSFNFTETFWLDANEVKHGEVWRLLTYSFLHEIRSPMHILFNMLFLWWFGTDVEELYGPREFLCFYLAAALVGGVVFTLVHWFLEARGVDVPSVCLGASGAVMAVMVLCACHYPDRTILLFFIVPVSIWLFIVGMVAIDAYTLLKVLQSGWHGRYYPSGTAVEVHLAGAGFAYLYYRRRWRLTRLWDTVRGWQAMAARPRLRVYREEPAAPVAAPRRRPDEHIEAELDAVLEKVARSGQASLTDREREVLLRASEVFRRRRT